MNTDEAVIKGKMCGLSMILSAIGMLIASPTLFFGWHWAFAAVGFGISGIAMLIALATFVI